MSLFDFLPDTDTWEALRKRHWGFPLGKRFQESNSQPFSAFQERRSRPRERGHSLAPRGPGSSPCSIFLDPASFPSLGKDAPITSCHARPCLTLRRGRPAGQRSQTIVQVSSARRRQTIPSEEQLPLRGNKCMLPISVLIVPSTSVKLSALNNRSLKSKPHPK